MPATPPSPWTTAPTRWSWPSPLPNSSRLVGRLREESILWEDLPFSRAYHTPSFAPVVGPIADFFAGMTFNPQRVPIYSCASRRPMPDDLTSIRELAVEQWTTTVAFRETIEAMHADGLRLFVDVGARGNLAGFVEDILRGKPAFAIAANLPRRSGLTQLNHLVASIFAQGVPFKTDYLYARRRPRAIDWNAPEPPARATVELAIGFPRMRLSDALVARLRSAVAIQRPHPSTTTTTTIDDGHRSAAHSRAHSSSPREMEARATTSAHPQSAAILSPSEPRLGSLEELLPESDRRALFLEPPRRARRIRARRAFARRGCACSRFSRRCRRSCKLNKRS